VCNNSINGGYNMVEADAKVKIDEATNMDTNI
jgi:hypothetical protein